jgi:hypothetical protein
MRSINEANKNLERQGDAGWGVSKRDRKFALTQVGSRWARVLRSNMTVELNDRGQIKKSYGSPADPFTTG